MKLGACVCWLFGIVCFIQGFRLMAHAYPLIGNDQQFNHYMLLTLGATGYAFLGSLIGGFAGILIKISRAQSR